MKDLNIVELITKLKNFYPDAKCSLNFTTPFEILVAVVLSAQCTDARVNTVTASVFSEYNTPQDFAKMQLSKLEELFHSCGFYRNKAKNIKLASIKLIKDFNGVVPNNMNDLMSLPGVGRKSANVIMLEAFNSPQGIAVDTHVKCLANRLGLSKESDPYKIELDLLKKVPKQFYKDINHLFVEHGRNICALQKPKCNFCPIKNLCEYYEFVNKKNK